MNIFVCGFNGFNQFSKTNKEHLNIPVKLSNILDYYFKREIPVFANNETTDLMINNKEAHNLTNDTIEIHFSWSSMYLLFNNEYLLVLADKMEEKSNSNSFKKYGNFKNVSAMCSTWNELYAIHTENKASISIYCENNVEDFPTTLKSIKKVYSTENNVLILQDHEDFIHLYNTSDRSKIDLSFPYKVKKISCGKHHVLILTYIGTVFSYGLGGQGQLGHGSVESLGEFKIIEALNGVRMDDVSAGGWHSMALSDAGDVYVWGWNNYGQLGLPSTHLRTPTDDCINVEPLPHLLEFLPDQMHIVKIACGSRHSLATTDSGGVYAWGWNKYGQLGVGHFLDLDEPTLIGGCLDGLEVKEIFAGVWNSAFVVD